MFLQFLWIWLSLVLQSDPTLERCFKGHRDSVSSVDISCNMKQIGNCYQSLFISFSLLYISLVIYKTLTCLACLCSFLSQPPALTTLALWYGTQKLRCELIVLTDTKMLSCRYSFLPLVTWWPLHLETRLYVFGCPVCELHIWFSM